MPNPTVRASATVLPNSSRRLFISRGAAAAFSGVAIGATVAAAIASPPSPAAIADDTEILAIADRYNAAEAHFRKLFDLWSEIIPSQETAENKKLREAAGEAAEDARWELLNTPPNTIAGVRAILEAILFDNYLSDEGVTALAENLLGCPALAGDEEIADV